MSTHSGEVYIRRGKTSGNYKNPMAVATKSKKVDAF